MKRSFILAAGVLLSPVHAQPAQTLIQREMFYGPGTYTAAGPGTNFSSVAGTFYLKAGGPRLAGELMGWSADGQASADFATAILHLPNASVSSVGAWFFVKALHSDAESVPQLMWLSASDVYRTYSYSIYHNQLCASKQYGANVSLANVLDVTCRWVWLQIAASNNAGNVTVRFYYKLPGGMMTNWYSLTEAGGAALTTAGFQPSWGQYGCLNGRIGAACTFTNTVLETEYPADVLEPDTAGMKWYVDSVNGSDTNSGVSPAEAWRTADKITLESSSCGLFPSTNWRSGNELIIATPAPLRVNGSTLHLRTPGLNVHAPANRDWILVRGDKVLTNSSFTQTPGYTNTWQTADTTNSITVWEDEEWMNHPAGATWASVANTLDSIPGSFWTDGTTLYVHPFGDSSPTNDGKTYTRSVSAATLVELDAPDMRVADLKAGKSVDCNMTDGSPNGSYIVGSGENFGGRSVIEHCYLYYGGKHILGLVADAVGSEIVITNVDCEQGSPYAWYGGQTPFVSYMTYATASNNVHRYVQCVCNANAGLIASTNGHFDPSYPVFYSHSGAPYPFSLLEAKNCIMPGGRWSTGPALTNLIVGGILGQVTSNGTNTIVDRVYMNGAGLNVLQDGPVEMRNCIFRPVAPFADGFDGTRLYSGPVTYLHNVFDLSAMTNTGVKLLWRFGPTTVNFSNNIVILPAASGDVVFRDFTASDAVKAGHNIYALGNTTWIAYNYSGSSTLGFADWQALAFDGGSKSVASARLDASDQPLGDSPAIGVVIPHVGQDATGRWFGNRRTAGAYEYQYRGAFSGFMR